MTRGDDDVYGSVSSSGDEYLVGMSGTARCRESDYVNTALSARGAMGSTMPAPFTCHKDLVKSAYLPDVFVGEIF